MKYLIGIIQQAQLLVLFQMDGADKLVTNVLCTTRICLCNLIPRDNILADRGFDIKFCHFINSSIPRVEAIKVEQIHIANVKIHVERVIRILEISTRTSSEVCKLYE